MSTDAPSAPTAEGYAAALALIDATIHPTSVGPLAAVCTYARADLELSIAWGRCLDTPVGMPGAGWDDPFRRASAEARAAYDCAKADKRAALAALCALARPAVAQENAP